MSCTCNLRTKVAGDGCAICNPSLAEQIAVENDQEAAILMSPDAVCVKGDGGQFLIRAGGFIIAKGNTEAEAWFYARYLLTPEERKAALRFIETCEDGEGYDVSKSMMKQLASKGFVVHKGGGWYEGTPALDRLQSFAEATA